MKHTEIHEKNEQFKKRLTEENKKQFAKIESYIQFGNTFKNPMELETKLNGFLHELIEAQKDGETVNEYVNNQPKEFAINFLSKLKNRPQELLKTVGVYLYVVFLINFALNRFSIDIVDLITLTVQTAVFWGIMKKLLQWDVFSEMDTLLRLLAGGALAGIAFALVGILRDQIEFLTWTIEIPFAIFAGIVFVVALGVTILMFVYKNESKVDWLVAMVLLWGSLIIGTLNYL
ncbi:hypothetical protein [Marinilactibacillus sp. Marseille-P9653]|uniref:hypothetical protein n=1 Tax=Marinilactibacillus sp. Marseille-P9653 TaxID=2866583 RepID=UPI001CE4170A|nr:hypothetical protein [Marinilactibacillus sp. Marseille-P9653]